MKKRLFLVAFSALMILGWQCRSTQGGGEGLKAEVVATDSLEYELLVMDSGYFCLLNGNTASYLFRGDGSARL